MAEDLLGGPGGWWWHQALNLFSGPSDPPVPDRRAVVSQSWLSWQALTGVAAPGNTWHVVNTVPPTSYAGVADPTPAGLAAAKSYRDNASHILGTLANDTNSAGRRSSFDTAAGTLEGVANWLTAKAPVLRTWRDRTAHGGDDFQGSTAAAYWSEMDDLVYRCTNLVAQLSRERTVWDALRGAKDAEAAFVGTVARAFDRWEGGESFTYDTGLGGLRITATGSQLAWPNGVISAIWSAPELVRDFAAHRPTAPVAGAPGYPESSLLGGEVSDAAVWGRLEEAAKRVWVAHQVAVLDNAAAPAVRQLETAYTDAGRYLPTVVTRSATEASAPPPPEGTGPPDGPSAGPVDGGGSPHVTTLSVPPPTVAPPPGPPGPTTVPTNGSTFPSRTPRGVPGLPAGSRISGDGTVIGPDGRIVLDGDGRPVAVPPGAWLGPFGVVGATAGRSRDRGRTRAGAGPDDGVPGDGAVLETYLKSLRRNPSPAPPGPASALPVGGADPLRLIGGPAPAGVRVGMSPTAALPPSAETGHPATVSTAGGQGARGSGGVNYLPPATVGGVGAEAGGRKDRERTSWLAEDERNWGTDPGAAPAVLGGRARRPTPVPVPLGPGPLRAIRGIRPASLQQHAVGPTTASGREDDHGIQNRREPGGDRESGTPLR